MDENTENLGETNDTVQRFDVDFDSLTDEQMETLREEILELDEDAIVEALAYIIDYKYALTEEEQNDSKIHKFLKDGRFWSYYEKILQNLDEEDENGTS